MLLPRVLTMMRWKHFIQTWKSHCNLSLIEIVIMMGDFNSKIGSTVLDGHLRHVVGRFGFGECNEKGQRLIQFCLENNLTIANTLFSQHPRRLFTSPDGRYRNQIDFILVKSRWRTTTRSCKTLPSSDVGSDHQLLACRFRVKLQRCCRRNLYPLLRKWLISKHEWRPVYYKKRRNLSLITIVITCGNPLKYL